MASNDELFKRAQEVIPGGVNSPVRAFKSVGGAPYFVDRAEGAYVWDVEGNRYIDYVQSYGASILGHAHVKVVEAIRRAALDGTTYGAPTEREVLLAETICERVAGCDMVRLVSSGTEATMSAVRVARGFTERDGVIVFDGCYHGHSDGLLAAGGSGMATLGLPASAGVPRDAVAHTTVAPYNVVPEVNSDVAAVLVEPIAANHGVIPPAAGFLEGLRTACDRAGALLIFDEVITGFRVGPGGASTRLGVRPDLWCFGKVIGGGLPLAAFGGRRDVMEVLAPVGPVYQAGTLSGNPLATAAGLAVLDLLDADAFEALERTAIALADGLAGALGADADVRRCATLIGLTVADYPALFHHLLDHRVALAPGAYEALFPSLAHGDAELEATVNAASVFVR
jgi:glutamate-1-semialdehyde 2,1-aminomutase